MAVSSLCAADERIDCSTLTGKVMCGYQGWFRTPDDGTGGGWTHYGKGGKFEPGACSIDFWPNVSELDADETFVTAFRHADGTPARVFSSVTPKTAMRHFLWMREYGIDGVFVQRFASPVCDIGRGWEQRRKNTDRVLENCRAGANAHGRAYAVMYDLSGMPNGKMDKVMVDWRHLENDLGITTLADDRAYLHHRGKPVVAVWGVGFGGKDRKYTLDECSDLIASLKDRGLTVMLGVPTGWRTLDRDSTKDARLHKAIRQADIISPWTVGRYRDGRGVKRHAGRRWKGDITWCRDAGLEYLPVVFPGFSWVNLKGEPEDRQIHRRDGLFLWSQYCELRKLGATMVYQAMFDEVDEGTQILKISNDPPVGESVFRTYEGLPEDHYLWLVGQATRMIRGEIDRAPKREGFDEVNKRFSDKATTP